ncbi:MAG TPA: prepilin-type N-terminal cleavage/methylation domain-containing protein [Phycisphaerae bacterium]
MFSAPSSSFRGLGWRARYARRGRGFSLIELLAALLIILILIAVLLPALRRSMRQAAATVCLHNLSELNHALQMYRYDNRGWLPNVAARGTTSAGDPDTAWFSKLMPRYFAEPAALLCPSDPFRRLARAGLPPCARPDFANASSYGLSDFILGSPHGFLGNREPPRSLATLMLADVGPDQMALGDGATTLHLAEIREGGHLSLDDGYRPGSVRPKASWLTGRHQGAIHVLTVGGGVTRVRTEQMMNSVVQAYYPQCAAGDCTICKVLKLPHYSFAPGLYWWTGPVPTP